MVLLDYGLSNSFFLVGKNIVKETPSNGNGQQKTLLLQLVL